MKCYNLLIKSDLKGQTKLNNVADNSQINGK
jgi:hypothetical protein